MSKMQGPSSLAFSTLFLGNRLYFFYCAGTDKSSARPGLRRLPPDGTKRGVRRQSRRPAAARCVQCGTRLAAGSARPVMLPILLVPALVPRIEHLRDQEVVRVDQQAELRPIRLREPHGEGGLAPVDLVVDRRARLRDVSQMPRVVDLGFQVLGHLDDVALLVGPCAQADDRT